MPKKTQDLQIRPVHQNEKSDARATPQQELSMGGVFALATIYAEGVDISKTKGLNGKLLIDTGADASLISKSAISKLGLAKYDEHSVSDANSDSKEAVYKIQMEIFGTGRALTLDRIRRSDAIDKYYPQDVLGVIGRDVLAHCKLVYDGVNGTATFEYDDGIPLAPIF